MKKQIVFNSIRESIRKTGTGGVRKFCPSTKMKSYPKSDAIDECRDVDFGDKASYSESERYKKDSLLE